MLKHWHPAAVAAVLLWAPHALADEGVALESRHDRAIHLPTGRTTVAAGGPIVFGEFVSVQVNTDASGQDVGGDAGNEPSIVVDPTAPNRIAVGWRQFDTIASSFREAGFAYSRDGGLTWEAGEIEPGLFRTDPVLRADRNGTFYYLSLEVTVQNDFFCDVFTSFDAGMTWPVKTFGFGGDKSWLAVDVSGGQGDGHLYQAWNTAGNEFFPNQFNRSVDGSASWEDPVEYDPGPDPARPVFGQVNVGPDGAVYVAGAQNSSNTDQFWVVRSTNAQDSGQTPSFDLISEPDLGGNLRLSTGPNPSGLLGQVNVAVDASGGANHGDVYVLCSVDPPGGDPMDVHFIRSDDGGATWSDPVRVNDDAGNNWQWFGTMQVAPDGRIDVVFNDTRNSGQTNISQLFYSFSDDGGLTWSPNIAVSPSFDSSIGWPQQNKLGDYYDMQSDLVGADVIYAATFLGGQDVYYLRIGDRDCNGNGTPDADDLAGGASGDCNDNDIPDECEIAAGELADDNGNGIPDICEKGCPWDLDASGHVSTSDLLDLLGQWGSDPGEPPDF
ncbi:MAG: sialidase family protein, partial [Planctomycetota bacterium]